MNKQNTQKLYKDFPELFKEHKLTIRESCMPWGFQYEEGWYQITCNMSKELIEYCKDHHIPTINITGIKEKYGTLRVEWRFSDFKIIESKELANKLWSEIESITTY